MEHFGIEHWLFIFCMYCMIGWVQESTIESLYHRHPINRGFLKGPYIPIYGVGGILLLFICHPFRDNGFQVFFVALLSCTALEYFTGWLMETVFGKQFWDYSMFRLTYKNRISLVSSLFWGVMGLFVTYVISDITMFVLNNLPHQFICVAGTVVTLIMAIDFLNTARKQIDVDKLRSTFSISNISSHFVRFDVIASRIPRLRARNIEENEEDTSDYTGSDENDD
ncbi:MAG: putative ABC transporter permease [Ruminiclostridium sp.]